MLHRLAVILFCSPKKCHRASGRLTIARKGTEKEEVIAVHVATPCVQYFRAASLFVLWRSEYPEEHLVLQWLARKMRRKIIAQDEENVVESSREQPNPNAGEQPKGPCSPP